MNMAERSTMSGANMSHNHLLMRRLLSRLGISGGRNDTSEQPSALHRA
jgi:hypothetical protein